MGVLKIFEVFGWRFYTMESVVIQIQGRISMRRRIFIHWSYVRMNFIDNDCFYAYLKVSIILSNLLGSLIRLLAMGLYKFLVQSTNLKSWFYYFYTRISKADFVDDGPLLHFALYCLQWKSAIWYSVKPKRCIGLSMVKLNRVIPYWMNINQLEFS